MPCDLCNILDENRICAFPTRRKFNSGNWNCGSMNTLRDFIEESCLLDEVNRDRDYSAMPPISTRKNRFKHHELWVGDHRDDMSAASIGIIRIPEHVYQDGTGQHGYITLTWYKNRGSTGNVIVVYDDEEPEKVKYDTVKKLIEYIEVR